MNKTALVTGGAGFIGSHLVEALLNQGMRVRVLDNVSTGSLENLRHCRGDLEMVHGDIRDLDSCYEACRGVGAVFHLAALPSIPRSIADPLTANEVNVDGTLQLLMAARDQGVGRFVFASSSAVYGNRDTSALHESLPPAPLSPHAIGKLTGEYYCRIFFQLYGLETVSLRYFNAFGPRQSTRRPYAGAVARFIDGALTGDKVVMHGDGTQSRDFIYVANVVQASLLASWVPGIGGSVFNVGTGQNTSLNDLRREIETATGRKLLVERGPARDGDVRHSRAEVSAARDVLRFEPATSLASGIERTVAWARDTRDMGYVAPTGTEFATLR